MMTLCDKEIKIEHPRKANYLYYMCLFDWSGAVLDEPTHRAIALAIIPNGMDTDGWRVTRLEDRRLVACGVKDQFLLGFYHSRIIIRFELLCCPGKISEVRQIRESIENFTEIYLKDVIFPKVQKVASTDLKAFIYPVFELEADCPLWTFEQTSPYTLSTTCFYTNLRDPEQLRWFFLNIPGLRILDKVFFPTTVNVRISGAKIITSLMSDWFFWNLTNLIYHEGLYKQCREQRQKISSGDVYKGMELRLEDFADRFMASFNQSITNVVQTTQNRWVVLLTIWLVIVTIILVFIGRG